MNWYINQAEPKLVLLDTLLYVDVLQKKTLVGGTTSQCRCFLGKKLHRASLTANSDVVLSYMMQTNASFMSLYVSLYFSKEISTSLTCWNTSYVIQTDLSVTCVECMNERKSSYTMTKRIWYITYRKPSKVFIPAKTYSQFVPPYFWSAAILNTTTSVSVLP